MIDSVLVRRILGTAMVLLLVGLGRVAFDAATSRPGYDVRVRLSDAGAGLGPGSDVKLRGIRIGQVTSLRLEDAVAVATLRLEPRPPVPVDVEPVVTAKTLLGEKQVELRTDGPLDPPYLEAGARLTAPRGPTELESVLASIDELFGDLDPDRLAVLVDALGSFDESDAEVVRRNVDAGRELAAFAAETADAQLERMRDLAAVLEAMPAAEITRLNEALPEAVGVLPDRQDDLRRGAEALSQLAVGFAELLEVEEPTIDRLFDVGDVIGASLDPRIPEIGRFLFGLYRYSLVFGQHGGSLTDGSEYAHFRAFLGDEGRFGEFCASLPPELESAAPGCAVDGGGS